MTIGESLRNLTASLPQILTVVLVYRLFFNELLHITVQAFKPPEEERSLKEKIVEAVKYHEEIYGRPASAEYVASYVYMEPARKMVDRWVESEKEKVIKIKEKLEEMVKEGKIAQADGGYRVS